MKKSKYHIDYFLTNPNFVSWIKHPNGDKDIFWQKWLKNHPDSKKAFHDAKAVIQNANFKTATISQDRKEEILDNILKDSTSRRYGPSKAPGWRAFKAIPWMMGTAAAILLFLAISPFFWNSISNDGPGPIVQIMTKYAQEGERVSFYLSDSTFVVLNSGSTLKYPAQFGSAGREVILIGEAYFDVEHKTDNKFSVRSGDIITEVHGTAFNVKAYADGFPITVSLERGLISVHSQLDILKEVSYPIFPGEKLTVSEDFGQSIRSTFDYESEFGWKDGILVFDESDLDDFIARVERWYGIPIRVMGKNKEKWAINGRFEQGESIGNVLKSLEFSRGVTYDIKDGQVTLYLK